jgi:hypothetical protein
MQKYRDKKRPKNPSKSRPKGDSTPNVFEKSSKASRKTPNPKTLTQTDAKKSLNTSKVPKITTKSNTKPRPKGTLKKPKMNNSNKFKNPDPSLVTADRLKFLQNTENQSSVLSLTNEQGMTLDAMLETGAGLRKKDPLALQRELARTGTQQCQDYNFAANLKNPACPMYLGESDEEKELFQQMEERCNVKPVGVFDDQKDSH